MNEEQLKETIYGYYWMTCYPNADEKEFKENWLAKNDNQAFVDGLVIKILEIYKEQVEELLREQRKSCNQVYRRCLYLRIHDDHLSRENWTSQEIETAPSPLGEKK